MIRDHEEYQSAKEAREYETDLARYLELQDEITAYERARNTKKTA